VLAAMVAVPVITRLTLRSYVPELPPAGDV
jgi:hypothetical protein